MLNPHLSSHVDLWCIAGPTASGKSSMALDLAKAIDGVIINADSMQIYNGVEIITAQPSCEDRSSVPHELYGFLSPKDPSSVSSWAASASQLINKHMSSGRSCIVVGGTGLYFRGLLEGLADIPPIKQDIREKVRLLVASENLSEIHREYFDKDPMILAHAPSTDPQRTARALEVFWQTGKPIQSFYHQPKYFLPIGLNYRGVYLCPPRDLLKSQIVMRRDQMMTHGLIEEMQDLLKQELDPQLPVMKACGLPNMLSYLRGGCALEEALDALTLATTRYAKRQYTWFNRNMMSWNVIKTKENFNKNNINKIIKQSNWLTVGVKQV
ncbi:MAG: tRNA (adenosine(37)-N6)-dimethylallyltransferase MiaA [Alphaproteobacteria bacterium]